MSINHHAHTYLRAFLNQGRFAGGLSFAAELDGLALDFSQASLERIDTLLDRLRVRHAPREHQFLLPQANQNFLYLLAFYVGETVAHLTDATINWYAYDELVGHSTGFSAMGRGFHTSAVCRYNQSATDRSEANFAPLVSIMTRLFDDTSRSVAFSGQGIIERLHLTAHSPNIDLRARLHALSDADRSLLHVPAPDWLSSDPLQQAFDAYPSLLLSGKVVWARVVDAPTALFESGENDLPGSIVYDPTGRLDHVSLIHPARAIMALAHTVPTDERLRKLHHFLQPTTPHEFGIKIPAVISPHRLRLSSILFHRRHLPNRRLQELYLPVIISDKHPGLVMALPCAWWPESLLNCLSFQADEAEAVSLAS